MENWGCCNGVDDIDIDEDAALEKTTGSPDVKVAVLDMGCDLDHLILKQNLITGFDATDGNDGSETQPVDGGCNEWDAHGTACAGLIATSNGVAQNCKIEPIRVTYSTSVLDQN